MMIVVALVLACIAALLHVFIFYLESISWTGERARQIFGTTAEEAAATRELAFNQGFYNLFLAVVTVVGVVLMAMGGAAAGAALVFAGVGSMAAAALVLFATSPGKRSAAVKQGAIPALAVIALAVALAV